MGPRFDLYANSLRSITLHPGPEIQIVEPPPTRFVSGEDSDLHDERRPSLIVHADLVSAWVLYEPDQRTFSHLRVLQVLWSVQLVPISLALAHNGLQEVRLELLDTRAEDHDNIIHFMTHISYISPKLTRFHLRQSAYDTQEQHGHRLAQCLAQWPFLEDALVQLELLPESMLTMTCLPKLKKIHFIDFVPDSEEDLPDRLHNGIPDLLFQSLGTVILGNIEIIPAAVILAAISSPSLAHVEVHPPSYEWYRDPDQYIPLTRALAKHPKLEVIIIGHHGRSLAQASRSAEYDLRDVMSPLLVLSCLQVVDMEIGQTWFADESLIVDMASAWRLLRILELDMRSSQLKISLTSLCSVLRLCPRLEKLHIAVNLTSPIPAFQAYPRTPNLSLLNMFCAILEEEETFNINDVAKVLRGACSSVMCKVERSHSPYYRVARNRILLLLGEIQKLLDASIQ